MLSAACVTSLSSEARLLSVKKASGSRRLNKPGSSETKFKYWSYTCAANPIEGRGDGC